MFGSTLNLGQDTTCIKHSVGGEGEARHENFNWSHVQIDIYCCVYACAQLLIICSLQWFVLSIASAATSKSDWCYETE